MNISFKGRELFTFDWPANNRIHTRTLNQHTNKRIPLSSNHDKKNMLRFEFIWGFYTYWARFMNQYKATEKKTKSCSNGKQWANMKKVDACCAVRYTVHIWFFIFAKGSAEFSEWQNKNYVHRLKNCGIKKYEPKRQKKETFFCLQWKIKDSWKKFYEQLHWNMKGKSRSNFEFMPTFSHYRQCVEQKKKNVEPKKSSKQMHKKMVSLEFIQKNGNN